MGHRKSRSGDPRDPATFNPAQLRAALALWLRPHACGA